MRQKPPADLAEQFRQAAEQSTDRDCRPLVAWLWNDRLDAREIRRQIRVMAAAGLSGFVIQPGAGLLTPWMSEDWLDAVEVAIDEARRVHLQVWLHDGMNVLSEASEIAVAATCRERIPSLSARALRWETLPADTPVLRRPDSVALFEAQTDHEGPAAFKPREFVSEPVTETGTEAAPGAPSETVETAEAMQNPTPDEVKATGSAGASPSRTADKDPSPTLPGSGEEAESPLPASGGIEGECDHGEAELSPAAAGAGVEEGSVQKSGGMLLHFYTEACGGLDALSPAAVRGFMDLSCEPYYREFGEVFRGVIPGIFTGAPALPRLPWSVALPAIYKELYGEEIEAVLPALAAEAIEEGVRSRYSTAVSRAIERAFSTALYQWCEHREVELRVLDRGWGKDLDEARLRSSLLRQFGPTRGAALLPALLTACAPHRTKPDSKPPSTAPADTRASSQPANPASDRAPDLARDQLPAADLPLTAQAELTAGQEYAFLGWRLYSVRGDRKRQDLPGPDLRQPEPSCFQCLAGDLGRFTFLAGRGSPIVEILAVLPAAGDSRFERLCTGLREAGLDFDASVESLAAEHGSVERGRLRLGRGSYGVVVTPGSSRVGPALERLLKEFAGAGGDVLSWGSSEQPVLSSIPARFQVWQRGSEPGSDMPTSGDPTSGAPISLQHRDDGRHQFMLLVNRGNETADLSLRIRGEGRLERWETATGEVRPLAGRSDGPWVTGEITIPAKSAAVLGLDTARVSQPGQPPAFHLETVEIPDSWEVTLDGAAVLKLDRCSFRLGTGDWQREASLAEVRRRVAGESETGLLHLRYAVEIDPALPLRDFCLVIEEPSLRDVVVNGEPLPARQEGFWLDPSLRRFRVGPLLHEDRNIILCTGAASAGVEPVYLTGAFTVERREGRAPRLLPLPRRLSSADVGELLPWVSGAVILKNMVDLPRFEQARIVLHAESAGAGPVRLRVNRRERSLVWPAQQVDVTELFQPGRNRVTVEWCRAGGLTSIEPAVNGPGKLRLILQRPAP